MPKYSRNICIINVFQLVSGCFSETRLSSKETKRDHTENGLVIDIKGRMCKMETVKMDDTFKMVMSLAETVKASGGRAMLVGGCVRDELMGIEPKDWDIEFTAFLLKA